MKKLIGIFIASGLLLASAIPAQGAWPFPDAVGLEKEQGAYLAEQYAGPRVSYISANKSDSQGKLESILCDAYGSGNCREGTGWYTSAKLTLGVCVDQEVNCIESVDIYTSNEKPQSATFMKNVDGPTSPPNELAGLPRGSTVSLWNSKELAHQGGNQNYAVWADVMVSMNSGKANFSSFSVGVVGVNETNDSMRKVPRPFVAPLGQTGGTGISIADAGLGCVYTQISICAESQIFAPNTRVSVKLRISNKLTGWLLGRLEKPNISVTPISKTVNLLHIDAAPTQVPTLIHYFNRGNFPDPFKKSGSLKWFWDRLESNEGGALRPLNPGSEESLDFVEAARVAKSDKSGPLTSIWSVSSLASNFAPTNRCLNDKTRLVGLVTTNSMAFEGGAPKFSNGYLQYKVAGMHSLNDSTLALGTYDLVMRSETARCLYGFGKAPLSATVSVVNEKGTKSIATTVVSEKNGWLKMAAYGFTFSKKTIKVKITKKKK